MRADASARFSSKLYSQDLLVSVTASREREKSNEEHNNLAVVNVLVFILDICRIYN